MTEPAPLFRVDPGVFSGFPDYIVGCVLARGIDNAARYSEIAGLLADAEQRARTVFGELDLKEEEPFSVWRAAFSSAGWSPSRFPASVEAMVKRVSRGQPAPRISPIVDLSTAATLIYAVPVGAHDTASFDDAPLTVRQARSGDEYTQPGGEQPDPPEPGEIVYACGSDVRTRRWVWRQSSSALIRPESSDIFFPVDGFADTTGSRVEAARDFIASVCRDVFGGEVQIGLITRDSPEFYG